MDANAVRIAEERYLLRDEKGNIVEDVEGMWRRVAKCVAQPESESKRWEDVFFDLMWSGDFLPNSPTIMNAGKEGGQLSACFVLPIEDSMEGIFTTLKNTALVHKTGGGTGFSFSSLRPEGAMVSNKTGVSTGPLAFCQVYDKATDVIKQGSSRRGANMMVMDVHHPQILEFIDMKMTPGVMENFNVSVAVTDEFMKALFDDREYELRHPFTGVTGKLRAKEVWDKIANNAWASGEPGVLFIDKANKLSTFEERLDSTNPCGEQWLPAYGSCNLGSINLANHVADGELDWKHLKVSVMRSTRFLDNVIDVNCYPLKEIEDKAKYYRNIGLGPMGWADALIKLKIPYNSEEALTLGKEVQRFINYHSHQASIALGVEKGLPEGAPFKTIFDYSRPYRRNCTCTNVAPTGTISMLIGATLAGNATSSGIEPNYAFTLERHQLETILYQYHYLYEKAKNNGGVDKKVFIEAHQVTPDHHVDMQNVFQYNVDNAISKTINLPADATVEDVQAAYFRAYESSCKGCTVYRDGSRGIGVLARGKEEKEEVEGCCDRPQVIADSGCETCVNCGYSLCAVA